MTPDETREVAALYRRVGALMEARTAWEVQCEQVHGLYLSAEATASELRNERDAALRRAESAEARVRELEALIAAGGAR